MLMFFPVAAFAARLIVLIDHRLTPVATRYGRIRDQKLAAASRG